MSCTGYACGSSSDANIPATSSAITPSCSAVARLGGQAARGPPQHPPRLEHVVAGEPVQRAPGSAAIRSRAAAGRPTRTSPAPWRGTTTPIAPSFCRPGGARAGSALDLHRQVALRRQPVPRMELPCSISTAHVLHDASGGPDRVGARKEVGPLARTVILTSDYVAYPAPVGQIGQTHRAAAADGPAHARRVRGSRDEHVARFRTRGRSGRSARRLG